MAGLFLLAAGVATSALAQNAINGAKLGYAGGNSVSFSTGDWLINGGAVAIAAQVDPVNQIDILYDAAFCGGPGGGPAFPHTLLAGRVYYTYFDTFGTIHESLAPPDSLGHPKPVNGLTQYTCSINPTTQGCCVAAPAVNHFAFAGSFLTDGTAAENPIPFVRQGHDVMLMPNMVTGGNNLPVFDEFNWVPIPNGAAPVSKPFTFAQYPASASAAILHFEFSTGEAFPAAYSLFILDSLGLGVVGGAVHPQERVFISSGANNDMQVRVALDSANTMTLWGPTGTAVAGSSGLNVWMTGYVENLLSPGR